jgi:hypothetical protein
VAAQQEAPGESAALRPQQTHQLMISVHLEHICFLSSEAKCFSLFPFLSFSFLFFIIYYLLGSVTVLRA